MKRPLKSLTLTDDDLDAIGKIADRLDAATYSAKMPLPPALHLQGLLGIIEDVRDELKAFVVERSQVDPWADHP